MRSLRSKVVRTLRNVSTHNLTMLLFSRQVNKVQVDKQAPR